MSPLERVRQELRRTNFAGRTVTLAEGAAVLAGTTGLLALRGRGREAATIGGIGLLGLIDDLVEPHRRRAGQAAAKGLRGHLRALARGDVTTGAVKVLGIPLIALAGTVPGRRGGPMLLVDAALVAGSANLVNLLDLRPGRALKAVLAPGVLLALLGEQDGGERRRPGELAGALLLTSVAALPADLREHGMLGDAGANALGALLGAAAVRCLPAPARAGALAGVVALTLASEKVSFSRVIEATPVLAALDRLGRRPADPAEGAA